MKTEMDCWGDLASYFNNSYEEFDSALDFFGEVYKILFRLQTKMLVSGGGKLSFKLLDDEHVGGGDYDDVDDEEPECEVRKDGEKKVDDY